MNCVPASIDEVDARGRMESVYCNARIMSCHAMLDG
jgi:hypothetical protein